VNDPAINLPDLLERIQNDYTLLIALLAAFQDAIISRRGILHEVIHGQCETGIRELIHLIKGSAGNISANAVFNTCKKIEDGAGKGYLVALEENFAVLDRQLGELDEYIAHILSSTLEKQTR
jgi:HPt (histidine-containing phosphotransfer) domain-containing protein